MIEKDHLGDWSPEKDWVTGVLLRTPVTQLIFFNHGNYYCLINKAQHPSIPYLSFTDFTSQVMNINVN